MPDSNTKDMLGRSGLVPVKDARELLLSKLDPKPETETVKLSEALGRVLAEAVCSHENIPPHPRSVMDGFAVCAADTFGASESMPAYLEITGSVAMGEMPEGEVARGTCFRIATGGFLPAGSDAVIMHEHTVPIDGKMIEIVKGGGAGTNIINVGDDIHENEEALPVGRKLRPQDLGLLAALGIDQVNVYRRIRVGIFSTGDEIIPHTEIPKPGKVRNINSIAIAGFVQDQGGEPNDYGIIPDEKETLFPALKKAVEENDLVIFSGGSSVGVRDLGEQAIEDAGPPGILVHGVKLHPGKPVLIGLSGSKPVIGLPGHPVSALVGFELFVKPTLVKLSGALPRLFPEPTVKAKLSRNINSAAGRLDLVRVRLFHEGETVVADPLRGRSGAISTLSGADGYFLIDEASQGVSEGETVKVFVYL